MLLCGQLSVLHFSVSFVGCVLVLAIEDCSLFIELFEVLFFTTGVSLTLFDGSVGLPVRTFFFSSFHSIIW